VTEQTVPRTTIDWQSVQVGDAIPTMVLSMTPTRIVAGAIASRDFMPVHHDRDYANQQGAPDMFMNILSDTAYCSRFLTDWAGPDAMVKRLAIRLGVPAFPGYDLTYTGSVTAVERDGEEGMIEVELRATNDLGEHITGMAERGGAPVASEGGGPLSVLDEAGFVGTLASNSEFEILRYLRLGEAVTADTVVESISDEKQTRLGAGHFLTWITTYRDEAGEVVGRQRFRILKFKPGAS